MPYTLHRLLSGDGALIDQTSHWDVRVISGGRLPDSTPQPFEFEIDIDSEGRRMPTIFTVPAFVVRQEFHEALAAAGVDNVDVYSVVIRHPETGEQYNDYVFLNVIGLVAAANLEKSQYAELGPGINVIDSLALDTARVPPTHIFRLAEDPQQIVISDHLYHVLQQRNFTDLHFQRADAT